MKYLILSDAASMHIYNFIRTALKTPSIEITIVSQTYKDIPKTYMDYYKERNVKILNLADTKHKHLIHKHGLIAKIQKAYYRFQLVRSTGKSEVCHVHFLEPLSCIFVWLNHRKFHRIILSYWGGDILNATPVMRILQKNIFRFADLITLTVDNTYLRFIKQFGEKYKSKTKVVRLANGGLSYIERIKETDDKQSCKRYLNIPIDKITITCGYNADSTQHQDITLQQINQLSNKEKKRLHIILPMQYANQNQDYIDRVKQEAAQIGCTYTIFDKYMDYTEMAKISIATDIFIHVRDTDAFSNSMKEQLYAGSTMIQGNWLKYLEFENLDLPIYKVSSFEEIPRVLSELLNDPRKMFESESACQAIWDYWSDESVRRQWHEVYQSFDLEKSI